MEIIGALKKSNSSSTIYFCEYRAEDFDRKDVVELLQRCRLSLRENRNWDDKDIRCIAVESNDELKSDKNLVGITFKSGDYYVSLTPQEYADIDIYLQELTGEAHNNTMLHELGCAQLCGSPEWHTDVPHTELPR